MNNVNTRREILANALVDVIANAPFDQRENLSEALDDYVNAYPVTIKKLPPFARGLFDAICMGLECGIDKTNEKESK